MIGFIVCGEGGNYCSAVCQLRARLALLEPVWEAAKAMRRGHEGCVTEPPCGSCFRCDFDRAVDAMEVKE
jgi:hypothetical protein